MTRTREEKERLELIKNKMDDTKALICVTDNSMLTFGKGGELISLYSYLTKELIENGVPENIIKNSVDFAIKETNKEEKISKADEIDKVLDKIENLLKEL